MTRPVTIQEAPASAPEICAKCGASGSDRLFYVDLGIDTTFNTEASKNKYGAHWVDGAIYFCDVCMHNLVVDFENGLPSFLENLEISRKHITELNTQQLVFMQGELDKANEQVAALRRENAILQRNIDQYESDQREAEQSSAEAIMNALLGEPDGPADSSAVDSVSTDTDSAATADDNSTVVDDRTKSPDAVALGIGNLTLGN